MPGEIFVEARQRRRARPIWLALDAGLHREARVDLSNLHGTMVRND
jgi:hypothetical protein